MSEQVLSKEQLLDQLKTRGFESGGFKSPLRHFRGKLTSITGEMVQRGQMQQAKLEITYNFDELEVIESTEPYPFPVAQISIMHSTKDKSAMGVLGASIDKIINADMDANSPQDQVRNQDALEGLMQEWKVTPGHMMPDKDDAGKWTETPRDAWEVVWVEGYGETVKVDKKATKATAKTSGPSASQKAIDLLDGKTIQDWNAAIFQDSLIKSDAGLINKIVTGQFIQPLLDSGVITKDDDDVYHKV
jgi:hypothetical protein